MSENKDLNSRLNNENNTVNEPSNTQELFPEKENFKPRSLSLFIRFLAVFAALALAALSYLLFRYGYLWKI